MKAALNGPILLVLSYDSTSLSFISPLSSEIEEVECVMVAFSHTIQAQCWTHSNWCLEMNNHDKPPLLWWKVGGSPERCVAFCSVYVIDLGSVHGTFVANERLSKDSPVELEVGQSLRFAASTRSYVLRKIVQGSTVAPAELPANFVYPPAPDASDEEAIVTYNTALNKLGVPSPGAVPTTTYLSRYCLLFE